MKVLVTGAGGFIASKLVEKLVLEGYEVFGIDNINSYYDVGLKYARLLHLTGIIEEEISYNSQVKSQLYSNYTFKKLDIEDRDNLLNLFQQEQFDVVCHLAAQAGVRYSIENPYEYINSNIVGFMNILEACRHNKVKHLIYASSSSVYGQNTKVPFSEVDNVDNPVSLYAATKKSNELMAYAYSHLYGIQTIGLRFFTVYGPWGRPDMAPFLFLDAIMKNREIKIFNNGELLRDFTYIEDVVNGIVKIMDILHMKSLYNSSYEIFNIGNSSPIKLMDFVNLLEKVTGRTAKKIFLPMQAGDVYQTYADTQKFEKNFKFKPYTSIEVGVEKLVKWYKSRVF